MTQRLKRGRSGRKILQHGGPGDCPIQTTALPASVTPVCAAGQPGEENARPVLEFSSTGTRQAPLTVRNRRNRRSLPSLARSVALPLVVLPDFLPGRLCLRHGDADDYQALEGFHYCARRPATWAGVLSITYTGGRGEDPPARVIAVAVLSWPTAVSRPRREVFGLNSSDYGGQLRFANRHVRTISRVIVHPQFRGLGLARVLVEAMCAICPTRIVEATAAMGAAHPLFERAGMNRHPRCDGGPAYYWLDRSASRDDEARPSGCATPAGRVGATREYEENGLRPSHSLSVVPRHHALRVAVRGGSAAGAPPAEGYEAFPTHRRPGAVPQGSGDRV